ncbi:MAG: hypothetical protein AB1445_11415 [Bacillota bacterium]
MIRDPLVLGGAAGLAGATVKAVVNHGAFLPGVDNLSAFHVTQRLIYHTALPLTGAVMVLSFVAFVLFGGLFGAMLS